MFRTAACAAILALSACCCLTSTALAAAVFPEDTILIGEYGSMTGSEATFGQSTHNGIMLAIEEQNAVGGVKGRKIAIQTYDTAGQTQQAGTVVTRLVTADKVVAVLGEVASSLSLAGGAVCQQYGVPMISPSSTNPRVTVTGDMIFRVCFIDTFQAAVCAKFVKEHLKATKVAILFDQGQAYSKGLKDDFKKSFTKLGGQITTEQAYTGGDQSFNAQLANIRDTKPDVVFIPGYYTDAGNIAIQARKLGLTVPLLGGDGWDSAKLVEIAGKDIEGCYFSNHYAPDEDRPEVKEFVKKYHDKFGQVPDALAALGYESAKLLFDAIGRAASLKGKDLAKAIAETKGFKGVTGTITIDKDRNAKKPAVIVQIREGKPRFVTALQSE